MALAGQVHVDAVGSEVIVNRQFVVAMVAHLLHDLQDPNRKHTLVNKRPVRGDMTLGYNADHPFRGFDFKKRSHNPKNSSAPAHLPNRCGCLGGGGLMVNTEADRHSISADVMLFM